MFSYFLQPKKFGEVSFTVFRVDKCNLLSSLLAARLTYA